MIRLLSLLAAWLPLPEAWRAAVIRWRVRGPVVEEPAITTGYPGRKP